MLMMNNFFTAHHISISRDKFYQLLDEHNLLVRKKVRRKPQTTWSSHWLKKYDNLIRDYIPIAPNMLWVSDITYVHVMDGFVYLSLVTDAYSRKIVGFELSQDLTAKGSIAALNMAFKNNPVAEGLIHHSDRGVQYCCSDYVNMLQKKKAHISMCQSGNPLENSIAERVNGILKDELLEDVYPCYQKAKHDVAIAISTYNYHRLHSSIDMLTPAQAHQKTGTLKKHWKKYYNTKKEKEVPMRII
jgi:transposase InsO family protein